MYKCLELTPRGSVDHTWCNHSFIHPERAGWRGVRNSSTKPCKRRQKHRGAEKQFFKHQNFITKAQFLSILPYLGLHTKREHLREISSAEWWTIKEMWGSSHILIGEVDVLLHAITLYGQAILSIDIWREGRKKGGEGGRERQTMEGGRRREVGEIDGWLHRQNEPTAIKPLFHPLRIQQ